MAAGEPESRFDDYKIYTTNYKIVGDHGIEANVIVPKDIKPGKHPLLVKFHGGGLITGTALYAPWFAPYLLTLATTHSAIMVAPNYRLLPESSGADILEDLADFWAWTQNSLPEFLASASPVPLTVDLTHILITGESAGGYMAIQSALTLPKGFIKALMLQYPNTQRNVPSGRTTIMTMPVPPSEFVDQHLASVKPGTIVSSAEPPERLDLMFAILTHARNEFLGKEKRFNLIEAIEDVSSFPSMWLMHGTEDEVVPVERSERFVEKLRRVHPGTKVRLTLRPGGHGFDTEMVSEREGWLREGLEWIEGEWFGE